MLLRRILAILIFILISQKSTTENIKNQPIIVITIPKCGTHLLTKCITCLTGKEPNLGRLVVQNVTDTSCNASKAAPLIKPTLSVFDKATDLYSSEFLMAHLAYDLVYEEILRRKKFKILFLIRDPRDQLVSRAFYIKKNPNLYPGLQHLNVEDILLYFIGSESEPQKFDNLLSSHLCFLEKPTQNSISNITQYYQSYLPWIYAPYCCTIKFENLVGPDGGGDIKSQVDTIRTIAMHIDLSISSNSILAIAQNLFGNSATFREGKIGAWKQYFQSEHKKLFKAIAGNLLVQLGYERDFNW